MMVAMNYHTTQKTMLQYCALQVIGSLLVCTRGQMDRALDSRSEGLGCDS